MAGLVPAIHVPGAAQGRWSPSAKTRFALLPAHDECAGIDIVFAHGFAFSPHDLREVFGKRHTL
jgi:hypothetical protein